MSDLESVEFLRDVDEATLGEIAARADKRKYRAGARLVSELESGADVFVILTGEAEVSVEGQDDKLVLGTLAAGNAFGEMSSLTGELRSATVTAKTDVEALVIADADFDRLRERRPRIAVALVRVLAKRLADAEKTVDALYTGQLPNEARKDRPLVLRRGSIGRVWSELVAGRGRDLTFLALASFVVTLLCVRGIVHMSFRFDFAPRDVLRTLYMTGFFLVLLSSAASVLTFRPTYRRYIALAYGIGGALILNELGVTLAFDIFYKDIHTPDPNVAFDVERLYRRTEPLRAIVIGLVVLVQAAYLRTFYQRAWFILRTRLRRRR
ncbi:MAG TPA: cyclic nucleotide-binding domain-containing protein [Polyangiaceae bacterium]